jgi:hypothetical protein
MKFWKRQYRVFVSSRPYGGVWTSADFPYPQTERTLWSALWLVMHLAADWNGVMIQRTKPDTEGQSTTTGANSAITGADCAGVARGGEPMTTGHATHDAADQHPEAK